MGIRTTCIAFIGIVALIVAALSAIKRESQTVPVWSIQFVDQLDRPFVRLKVEQYWRNYSLEDGKHTAIEQTNDQGIATFPARKLRHSLLRQFLGPASAFLFHGGIHASYGPQSNVFPMCSLLDRGPILSIMLNGNLPTKTVLTLSSGGLRRPECAAIEAQAREADRLIESAGLP